MVGAVPLRRKFVNKGASGNLDIRHAGISGTVSGTTSQPILAGSRFFRGEANVVAPVPASHLPLEGTGTDIETLTIDDASCGQVSGSFIPSFNSRGSPVGPGIFLGTARWNGHRV